MTTLTTGAQTILAFRRRFIRSGFARTGEIGFPRAMREREPDLFTTAFLLPQAAQSLERPELARAVGWVLTHQGPGGGFSSRSRTAFSPAALTALVHQSLLRMHLGGARSERWSLARRKAAAWLAELVRDRDPGPDIPPAELGWVATALAVTAGVQHAPLLYRKLDPLLAALSHRISATADPAERLWLATGLLGVFHELGSRGHLEQIMAVVDALRREAGRALAPGHDALLVTLACEIGDGDRVSERVRRLGETLDATGVVTGEGAQGAVTTDPADQEVASSALIHEALCRYAREAGGRTQVPIWIRTGPGELEIVPERKRRPGIPSPAVSDSPLEEGSRRAVFLANEPPRQACPYLRVHSPLSRLAQQSDLAYELGTDVTERYVLLSPAAFERADVLIIQRLFPAWLLGAATMPRIERSAAAIVYDLDDLLFEMPPDHPRREVIAPALGELGRALVKADVVTTSTHALARALSALGAPRVVRIPNAIDPADWPAAPATRSNEGDRPLVLGMIGTATHAADYARISDVLLALLERSAGEIELVIWGDAPASLASHPSVRVDGAYVSSYREYAEKLSSSGIDIGLVPLAPNAFNEAKSAIKWLELSAAGIAGLYPRMGEYAETVREGEDGLLAGGDPSEWANALNRLVSDAALRRHLAASAHSRVRREHTIDTTAGAWGEALDVAVRTRRERRARDIAAPSGANSRNPVRIPLGELIGA